jgi:hypothetical protein
MSTNIGIDCVRPKAILACQTIIRPGTSQVQGHNLLSRRAGDGSKLIGIAPFEAQLLHILNMCSLMQMSKAHTGSLISHGTVMHNFHPVCWPTSCVEEKRDNMRANKTFLLRNIESSIARTALACLPRPATVFAKPPMLTDGDFRPKIVSKRRPCSAHQRTAPRAILGGLATGWQKLKRLLAGFVGTNHGNARNAAHAITSTVVKEMCLACSAVALQLAGRSDLPPSMQ